MSYALRRRLGRAVVLLILLVVAVVMLFPFYYILTASLRSFQQFEVGRGFSLTSWQQLLAALPVVQELRNSSIVAITAIAIILAVSTMAGYAFAKLQFRGAGVVLVTILACMMVPVQSIIIPEYVNLARLGLVNNFTSAIFVYAALGAPFATFLMTTYFRGVPDQIIEAAILDGVSFPRIFVRLMLPLAVPALVTVSVLQFVQIWDDLLVGLLFLQNPAVRTITVGIATLDTSRILNVPVLMAGSLVSAVPAVIVYLIFQRYLVTGLTMGMGK